MWAYLDSVDNELDKMEDTLDSIMYTKHKKDKKK